MAWLLATAVAGVMLVVAVIGLVIVIPAFQDKGTAATPANFRQARVVVSPVQPCADCRRRYPATIIDKTINRDQYAQLTLRLDDGRQKRVWLKHATADEGQGTWRDLRMGAALQVELWASDDRATAVVLPKGLFYSDIRTAPETWWETALALLFLLGVVGVIEAYLLGWFKLFVSIARGDKTAPGNETV